MTKITKNYKMTKNDKKKRKNCPKKEFHKKIYQKLSKTQQRTK